MFEFLPSTSPEEHQTSAQPKTIAVYPAVMASAAASSRAPTRNDPPDLQVPASTFQAQSHKDETSAISIVAEKIRDLPAMKGNWAVSGMDYAETDDIASKLIRAHSLLDQQNWAEAAQLYDDVLSVNRRNHAALAGKLYAEARDNNLDQAITAGLALHAYYPDDTASNANLARVYARSGDYEQAIRYMEIAAQQARGYLPYRLNLATYYDHAGDEARALQLYEQVVAAANGTESLSPIMPGILMRIRYLDDRLSSTDDGGGDAPATSPDEMR